MDYSQQDRFSPSDKQIDTLKRFGVDTSQPLDRFQAWRLINDLVGGQRSLPATPKQEGILRRRGYWRQGMTRGEAFDLIKLLVESDQGR